MLEVGQTVYIVAVQCADGIIKATIEKIGRKYITVKLYSCRIQFDKETLIQKNTGYGTGANYKLYLTLSDYIAYANRRALIETIEKSVQRYGWDKGKGLFELREIAAALGVEKEAEELAASRELTIT